MPQPVEAGNGRHGDLYPADFQDSQGALGISGGTHAGSANILPNGMPNQFELVASSWQVDMGISLEHYPDGLFVSDNSRSPTTLDDFRDAVLETDRLECQNPASAPRISHASRTNTAPKHIIEPQEASSQTSKRQRIARGVVVETVGHSDGWLEQYMSDEKGRCASYNVPPPEETFFTPDIRTRLEGLDKKHANTLLLIQVTTASGHAVAALHQAIMSNTTPQDTQSLGIESETPASALFHKIEQLDDKIAQCVILRRYHVLHLFEMCLPPNSRVNTTFIMTNPGDFDNTKKAGNPGNNAKSEVTRIMMSKIFPDISPDMGEYLPKYNKVSRLQVLGRRYSAMAQRFTKGILGLMPPPGLAKHYGSGISDHM